MICPKAITCSINTTQMTQNGIIFFKLLQSVIHSRQKMRTNVQFLGAARKGETIKNMRARKRISVWKPAIEKPRALRSGAFLLSRSCFVGSGCDLEVVTCTNQQIGTVVRDAGAVLGEVGRGALESIGQIQGDVFGYLEPEPGHELIAKLVDGVG
jgi:hypothetical protein